MIYLELASVGVKWSGIKSALVYVGAAIAEIAGYARFSAAAAPKVSLGDLETYCGRSYFSQG